MSLRQIDALHIFTTMSYGSLCCDPINMFAFKTASCFIICFSGGGCGLIFSPHLGKKEEKTAK